MRIALALSLSLALAACGALRNGGGLMGNKAVTGGTFTVVENGKSTVFDASP